MSIEAYGNWGGMSIDAYGNSRGLVTAWSPILQRIAIKKHDSVLETKLRDGETGIEFTILNVYGPFFDRKTFWENFSHSGSMDQEDVILGGRFTFNLNNGESMGRKCQTIFSDILLFRPL